MTIAEILDKEGVSEQQVLREHAMLTGLANISKYEAQCSYFEKKHAVSFDTARAKYREVGKEDFGFDLQDWPDGLTFPHHKHVGSEGALEDASEGGDFDAIFAYVADQTRTKRGT